MIDQKKRNMPPAPVVIKATTAGIRKGDKVQIPTLGEIVYDVDAIVKEGETTFIKLKHIGEDGKVTFTEVIEGSMQINLFIEKLTASKIVRLIFNWLKSKF